MLNLIKRIFLFDASLQENKFDFNLTDSKNGTENSATVKKEVKISKKIKDNKTYIESRFSVPKNNDVVIKELKIKGDTKAFVLFYDGMCDGDQINEGIIKPLLEIPLFEEKKHKFNKDVILNSLIVHNQVSEKDNFDDIIDDVNFGSCALFVDGINVAFSMDVKDWPHRSVEKAENEQSIYGPQEAFADMLRGNSAQVRKILKTESVICEKITVGKVSKTRGVIMYIDGVANKSLIDEVKRRIDGISTDYIFSVEEISMYIEENPFMITGHILATERPDRVARMLADGRVGVILNGSPRALILPTNAYELLHSASDAYLRFDFANMSRILRLVATGISVLLPGLFLAITLFHEEMLPTYLLYAISASRQNVPFPSLVELLLMDFSFEMIREAGLRMPNPIGSVLGIVGGLILGQAAVSAKIVSPIMIIVIAITGIGSFATADYSLSWSYRILKFLFVISGAMFGFLGIALGIFTYSMVIAGSKSFGVPFLSPGPSKSLVFGSLFVPPIWKTEKRHEFLKPIRRFKQPKISKKWRYED